MKIIYINTYYNIGSTGNIVNQLGSYMESKGDSVIYCAAHIKESSEVDKIYHIGTKLSHTINKIKNYIMCSDSILIKYDTKRLIDFIEKNNPDIIHIHNIHGFYLDYVQLCNYLSSRNRRVVWTFHDCWPITGRCAHFFDTNCVKWISGCSDCPNKNAYPRSLFFDYSKRDWLNKKQTFTRLSNLRIVPVSNWLESYVKKSFLNNKYIKTIYNGIDTSIFYPRKTKQATQAKFGLPNKKIILGVASGWTERKGINDFLKLSKQISNEAVIVLVGECDRQLPNNIIHLGLIRFKEDLAELYSLADVFVNPSRQETFGLTTAEALSSGTPVVAYNVTATPELIPNKYESMFLAKAYEFDSLLLKIKETLYSNIDSEELHNHIKNKFSLIRCNSLYRKLYIDQVDLNNEN